MKVKDGISGFVVGDALGLPVEFESREKLSENPITGMKGNGTYNMPKGTFSDDTSMTLATINAIIKNNGKIEYYDIMLEFLKWLENSKYTQYNSTFDVGNTTLNALYLFKNHIAPLECGGGEIRDNGNGSLMRILPLAFIEEIDFETIENVSTLTHRHIISKIACNIYVEIAKSMLNNENLAIKDHVEAASLRIMEKYGEFEELENYEPILNGTIYKKPLDEIKSSGYVVDTLESVIYVLGNTNSYKEAVLKAVNLGNDTDTIAAICGGLAGIYYGFKEIPQEWLEKIKDMDKVINLCEKYEEII